MREQSCPLDPSLLASSILFTLVDFRALIHLPHHFLGVKLSCPNMDDKNLAIVLALVLITLVIIAASVVAFKWIEKFTGAMARAKEAERVEAIQTLALTEN